MKSLCGKYSFNIQIFFSDHSVPGILPGSGNATEKKAVFSAKVDFPVWETENKQANDIMSGAQEFYDEKYRRVRRETGQTRQ